jgi:hypothetical protein
MSLSRLLILGISLFFISGFSYGDNFQKQSSANPTNKIKKQKNEPIHHVIIDNPVTTFVQKSESEESGDNYKWTVGDKINFSLVLITFGLAVFTALLFRETKRLVDSSTDTSKRQLRAYISAHPPESGHFVPQIENPRAHRIALIQLRNTGQTPASELFGDARACVLPLKLEDFKYPYNQDTNEGSVVFIGAGQPCTIPIQMDEWFTDDEWESIVESTDKRIYVYGTFFYKDVFWKPAQAMNKTNFCFRVDFYRTGPDTVNVAWTSTKDHNDAT